MNPFQVIHDAASRADGPRAVLDAVDRLRGNHLPAVFDGPAPVRAAVPSHARVSVIIPCYNYARFLPDSIGSSLAQADVDVEVIVVNDASTDDTAVVAGAWAERDDRVQMLSNPQNQGHVRTFNNGYAQASGEFIVRLDADDLLTPGSLRRAVELFRAFPDVGLVYGHPRHFTSERPPAPSVGQASWTVWSGRTWLEERCRRGVNCITTPEAVIRGSVMAEIGPLSTELKYAQDMEMWLRVSTAAGVGRIGGVDQALHRDHPTSMSVTVGSGAVTDLNERRVVFQLVLDHLAGRGAEVDALRETASRTLAAEALDRACHAYDRGQTDVEPVDELVAFAADMDPDYRSLPQWRALTARTRVGERWAPWVPTFAASAVGRRVDGELAYLRWTRRGV